VVWSCPKTWSRPDETVGSYRVTFIPILLLAAVVIIPVRGDAQGWPAEATEVLGRFVGEWETETRMRHEGVPPRESQTRGKGVGRETLEGRYVEFRSWSVPAGYAELQIMTYDGKAGRYRQWVFDSDGYRHEATGRWDRATSTLTWEGTTGGSSFVIEDRWVSSDRLEWTLRRTDAKRRRLQTVEGVLTRVR
jgi:hypothetical protein